MTRFGKLVEIDLSSEKIRTSEMSEDCVRRSLGGFGFNIEHLYRRVETEMDPLDPANLLMISRGLLTGTLAPSSSRVHINALSPQSGLIGSSNVGGFLGFRMYSLGIHSLIIGGRALHPVYLYAGPNGVEIRDARHLWGLDTRETEKRLRRDAAAENTDVLTIGPAGENAVAYACIMAGWDHAAGRTGLGSLMGAKKLKAVVMQAEPKKEKMTAAQAGVVREYVGRMKKNASRYRDFSTWGSAADILETNQMGMLGTRNYQHYQLEDAAEIDGRALTRFVKKKRRCHRCPISCKAEIELAGGRYAGFKGARPEYETVIDLGSLCGLSDAEALLYLSNLCNMLGLDTISTGSVIAFAMELYQRGILGKEDTGGITLDWGDARAMEVLINKIAAGDGLGAVLGQGVRKAAGIIGRGAGKYAYHVKGVELYGGDPRGTMGIALAYAVSMRGGDYTSVYPVAEMRYSPEQAEKEFGTREVVDLAAVSGKGAMVKKCMIVSAVIDSLGLCKVPALSIIGDLSLEIESRLIAAITGVQLSPAEIFRAGERIVNMEKIINIRQKSGPEDDTLPDLFLDTPVREGPMQGRKVDLAPMIAEFYQSMGWDAGGRPTDRVLTAFGLRV